MPTRLISVVMDAHDPSALGRFWAGALGWAVTFDESDEVVVEREDATGDPEDWGEGGPPSLVLVPVDDEKVTKNRVHLDLATRTSAHQHEIIRRLSDLGADTVDIGQSDVPWEVLADPEGNEFCVLDPREDYKDTEGIAAVVIDCLDPQRLAPFWAAATGWEPVRSSSEFVALAHPTRPTTRLELLAVGEPKTIKNRLHIDVAPTSEGDLEVEVARLQAAGAEPVDVGQRDVSWVVLADPEGNELCVLTPR